MKRKFYNHAMSWIKAQALVGMVTLASASFAGTTVVDAAKDTKAEKADKITVDKIEKKKIATSKSPHGSRKFP